jgi:hypothetical protein
MSAFRVGQRVRLVSKSIYSNSLVKIGTEGVISAIGPWREGDISPTGMLVPAPADYWVAWDSGEPSLCTSGRIEPAIPPHVAGSWEVIEKMLPNIRERVTA